MINKLDKNPKLLIIGGASLDTLRINGKVFSSPGGAGLYTSLAAVHMGASVTLFSPVPVPMPKPLKVFAKRVHWTGPHISQEKLPSFHIDYKQGKTIYKKAFFGAEETLSTEDLPQNISSFNLVHVAPLGNIKKQLEFVSACRERGATLISAGTGKTLVKKNRKLIKDVIATSDLFFINNEEFGWLYPKKASLNIAENKRLWITNGLKGATVFIGNYSASISPTHVNAVDSTGAGDTFCGGVIAGISKGEHPIKTSQEASILAADIVTGVGPEKLLSSKNIQIKRKDNRAILNYRQINKTAKLISELIREKPFNFISSSLPPLNHPMSIDYFFVTILQQFGFWTIKNNCYHEPLLKTVGGERLKGAFYLFKAYLKKMMTDPEYFNPKRQVTQSLDELTDVFLDDNKQDVMPKIEMHLDAAKRYGHSMLALGWSPKSILNTALKSNQPLKTFLSLLDFVGGYKEDPLRKKSTLLAMILNNRPERYFDFGKDDFLPPIIDYHCMRSCLRMGLITVTDKRLKNKLENRRVVSEKDEWIVRTVSYEAVKLLQCLSGRSMAVIDQYFFFSRERCPELSPPQCSLCSADLICTKNKTMFQPVFRTDFY